MEEDIFDLGNDKEIVGLLSASKSTVPNMLPSYRPSSQMPEMISDDDIDRLLDSMPVDPVPPPAPMLKEVHPVPQNGERGCTEKVKRERKVRPWILSTHKTLVEFGHVYYEGKDFSFDTQRRFRRVQRHIEAEWKHVFYSIIMPNGIIARECGGRTSPDDAIASLDYAMTVKRTEGEILDWERHRKTLDIRKMKIRFNFYANGVGISKDGKEYMLPENRLFSHGDYVLKVIGKFAAGIPEFDYSANPKLRELIGMFDRERSIGSMSTLELKAKFGFSLNVANSFRRWIKERRESGRPDGEFTVSY